MRKIVVAYVNMVLCVVMFMSFMTSVIMSLYGLRTYVEVGSMTPEHCGVVSFISILVFIASYIIRKEVLPRIR